MWHKYHFSTPLSQIWLAAARVVQRAVRWDSLWIRACAAWSRSCEASLTGSTHDDSIMCPFIFSVLCSYFFLLSLIWFCLLLAVSSPGYRIPCVALSALVIDRHARWQIDHYSHRRAVALHRTITAPLSIDLPGRCVLGSSVPTKDSTSDTPLLC